MCISYIAEQSLYMQKSIILLKIKEKAISIIILSIIILNDKFITYVQKCQ